MRKQKAVSSIFGGGSSVLSQLLSFFACFLQFSAGDVLFPAT